MDNEIKGSLNEAIRFLLEKQKPDGYGIAGFSKESISTAIEAIVYVNGGQL